jgi:SAM-dependent methyltransferase/predicted RNA-binding Zn-ribbon protein involved in translation (DUF1610 family)
MDDVTKTVQANAASFPCPACGRPTRYKFRFCSNGCGIWQCQDCGLGRTETTGFDPASYYTGEYFSGQRSDGYSDYRGAEPVLRREFARTVEFIRRYRNGGKLIDLGCAYGFFLKEARGHFDVSGIELAEAAAHYCRSEGFNVLSGVADEATMQRLGEADVMTLFDVIEHLPDPRATLALCARRLKPGGVIVITTGDFGSLSARLAGMKWRLMTPPQHLWFFSKESMRRMSHGVGLTMEHVGHPWKIVPLSLIVFQLRRMLGLPNAPVARASAVGVPVNLFDAMRVVLRKRSP